MDGVVGILLPGLIRARVADPFLAIRQLGSASRIEHDVGDCSCLTWSRAFGSSASTLV